MSYKFENFMNKLQEDFTLVELVFLISFVMWLVWGDMFP